MAHRVAPFVPTSKPRVAVTLEEEVYRQVEAIAKAERRSLGNLIAGWVEEEIKRRTSDNS